MIKLNIYLVLFCIPCFGMENNNNTLLIAQPKKINIGTMKMCYELPINDDSTIIAIKKILEKEEGIPVEQQNLKVRAKGEPVILMDNEKIKDIIRTYNSDFLYLSLRYRNNQ